MTNTEFSVNGHGQKRAVLYARVSTQEQVKHGYSLRQQLEALRQYAQVNGYEVLEEVVDEGHSGATLDRPGLGRIRDLVAAGGVDVVLCQDRDRMSREPWHYGYLKALYEDHGAKLRSLDAADESPMDEFVGLIKDGVAKLERADIIRRTQRGRRQRIREGKIIASKTPPYGYTYNEDKSNYVVDERAMVVVGRIFELSSSGASLTKIKKTLEADGTPAPKGGRYWYQAVIRDIILNDMNRPHTFAELERLVADGSMAPETLESLDPAHSYGVWYYNQEAVKSTHGGATKRKVTPKPQSEWLAVPTPDSGIPVEWVDKARENIKGNIRPSNAGRRVWPLSGLIFCPCGYRLGIQTKTARGKNFFYYTCRRRQQHGPEACPHAKYHNAQNLERRVSDYVLSLVHDPETLRKQVQKQLEAERKMIRNSDREIRVWLEQIADADRKRARNQEMYRADAMTLDELKASNDALARRKVAAEAELDKLRDRERQIRELNDVPRLVDEFLDELRYHLEFEPPPVREYAATHARGTVHTVTPDSFRPKTPEEKAAERRRWQNLSAEQYRYVYDLIRLKAVVEKDGSLELSWLDGCKTKETRSS